MSDYKAQDNIYWLFSSSAQAIAAFIGFLAAGFFFSHERIDKHIEKDETLEDIYNDIRKQYYKRTKVLFSLTGLSIILSLFVVYLNRFDSGIVGGILKIAAGLLNIITIIAAIQFVLFMIDPEKVKKTTQKLVKENETFFKDIKDQTLTRGIFIEKFIELEKLLRALAEKYQISIQDNPRFRNFLPLGEIIRVLYQREIISGIQFHELMELNKIRNLAAHGDIQNIEPRLGKNIDNLLPILKSKLDT